MTDIKGRIPRRVLAVMEALAAAGHRGYLVGGSLRDLLLGVTPHDYDLTTDATPEEMLVAFSDFRVIPTGLKHGTLTVLSDGESVEVTTHRVDGTYTDSRRPDSVAFTGELAEDLSRRDFTVNAMAWHPEIGLVDLFGGRDDLARGMLRAVGDPRVRFTEDALRILRAFRFSAQLDFTVEENTQLAARDCREGLARISVERVFAELTRLLASPAAARGLSALLRAGCAPYVFFDLPPASEGVEKLDGLSPDAALRLAYLLRGHDHAAVRELCRRWHAPNAFADGVCGLLCAIAEPLPDSPYTARRYVTRHWRGWQGAMEILSACGVQASRACELCRTVARDGSAVELRRLALNGREVQELVGVRPEDTAAALARLQDHVWRVPTDNKKHLLLEVAKKLFAKEQK